MYHMALAQQSSSTSATKARRARVVLLAPPSAARVRALERSMGGRGAGWVAEVEAVAVEAEVSVALGVG